MYTADERAEAEQSERALRRRPQKRTEEAAARARVARAAPAMLAAMKAVLALSSHQGRPVETRLGSTRPSHEYRTAEALAWQQFHAAIALAEPPLRFTVDSAGDTDAKGRRAFRLVDHRSRVFFVETKDFAVEIVRQSYISKGVRRLRDLQPHRASLIYTEASRTIAAYVRKEHQR